MRSNFPLNSTVNTTVPNDPTCDQWMLRSRDDFPRLISRLVPETPIQSGLAKSDTPNSIVLLLLTETEHSRGNTFSTELWSTLPSLARNMASELSELRAELWRTRDNLERMKSRTPPSAGQSSHRLFNRRHHADGKTVDRENAEPQRPNERDRVKDLKLDRCAGGGVRSGPTSPPSGGSSRSDQNNGRSGDGIATGRGFSEEMAAEETLSSLALEGAAFKNWTEEASSIAVRLIEEVKTLRWERVTWTEREAATERAATELKKRTEALERRLLAAEEDARRTKEALLRAQDGEREQARATERAEQDLRAARKRSEERWGRADGLEGRDTQVGRSLREELRREKEGADALQRRLDQARAASARHEVEKKEWHASRERLEELRRLWGKQLRKACLLFVFPLCPVQILVDVCNALVAYYAMS